MRVVGNREQGDSKNSGPGLPGHFDGQVPRDNQKNY